MAEMPVKDGYWMMRGKYNGASLSLSIPQAGAYKITFRARRVGKNETPQLRVYSSGGDEEFLTDIGDGPDYEWREYGGILQLPAGDVRVWLGLTKGWAVDLDWVQVNPEAAPEPGVQ